MRVRSAVRSVLSSVGASSGSDTVSGEASNASDERRRPLVLVALSGGADSLALAAALAAEAPAAGVRAGAVIVDHGLQEGSAAVAARAAEQATGLGLSPVLVRLVAVSSGRASVTGGTEAAARAARYDGLAAAAAESGAGLLLTAHTRDDQAEQVLLALARGSGTRSLSGIRPERALRPGILIARPLLDERFGVTREVTEAACSELDLEPWRDPHNADRSFARVRVRLDALPRLERELGPGFAAALARSADLAREDADALDELAEAHLEALVRYEGGIEFENGGENGDEDRRAVVDASALRALPAALRGRVIRLLADRDFGSHLTREHTLAIASLVTTWKGQGSIHAPRMTVTRERAELVFRAR